LSTAAEADDDADAELNQTAFARKTLHVMYAGTLGFEAGKCVEVWDVGG